jgi:hypothetical protein
MHIRGVGDRDTKSTEKAREVYLYMYAGVVVACR